MRSIASALTLAFLVAGTQNGLTSRGASGFYVEGAGKGQGVVRGFDRECYLILPYHVIGAYPVEELRLIRKGGMQEYATSAVFQKIEGEDLAVIRLVRSPGLACEDWMPLDDFDALLGISKRGYLNVTEVSGEVNRVHVVLTTHNGNTISVRREDGGEFGAGLSGAPLYANGALLGLFKSIDTKGLGVVQRIDRVRAATADFFARANSKPPAQAMTTAKAQAVLERARQTRDLSQMGQVTALQYLLREGQTFQNADFTGISFKNAVLEKSLFDSAIWKDADLAGARLDFAELASSNFNFANLTRASLRGVRAPASYFHFVRGSEAACDSARDLSRSSFALARLDGASFRNAKLRGASFAFCDLRDADFRGADLSDAIFFSCVLEGADFRGAVIRNTDMTASVAANMEVSQGARREFRRSGGLSYFAQLSIWQMDRRTKRPAYNAARFNSVDYIQSMPEKISGTLRLRDKPQVSPVGPFVYYEPREANVVNQRHFFYTDTWYVGHRANRIQNWSIEFIRELTEQMGPLPPVKGSGTSVLRLVETMETNIAKAADPELWVLDDDLRHMLYVKYGLKDLSEWSLLTWNVAARNRCYRERNERYEERRSVIFPAKAPCEFIYWELVEPYIAWMTRRIETLEVKRLQYTFARHFYWSSIRSGARQKQGKPAPGLWLFEHVEPFRGNWNMLKQNDVFEFPEPFRHYKIRIDANLDRIEEVMGGQSLNTAGIRMTFRFEGIRREKELFANVLSVVPERATLVYKGETLWEGPVLIEKPK